MTQLPVAVVFSGATGHDTRLLDRRSLPPPLLYNLKYVKKKLLRLCIYILSVMHLVLEELLHEKFMMIHLQLFKSSPESWPSEIVMSMALSLR